MPNYIVAPLDALVDKLESLPGIGHKTAQRLAYHILNMSESDARAFAEAIINAHEKIHYCKDCCNLTDGELCPVCRSDRRDRSLICVVEEPKDVFALERAGDFPGLYHVLHGTISPLAGVGPDQLKIKELLARIGTGGTGGHHGHQPHRGGGRHGAVPGKALKAPGGAGHTAGLWHTRGRRLGVCGQRNVAASAGGPQRPIIS